MTTRRAPGAASLLKTRAGALRRFLPVAIGGDRRGVHQARVASRRLREAVPVLTTGVKRAKSRKAVRKIRRLTRALGKVRELDATLQLLDELAVSDELPQPAFQDVRLRVVAERERLRGSMLAVLAVVDTEKLDRRLLKVCAALDADQSGIWRQALASRLLRRARRLSEAIDTAGQLYAPEHLHRVRIAAKKLRYGLELAADSGITGALPLVRSVKRAQATLGRLHDLQVLQTHVAAVQAAPQVRPGSHEGLAAISGRIEEQCRLLHGTDVASVPALNQVTAAVRAEIVPRLARQTRQLKMTLARRRKTAGATV